MLTIRVLMWNVRGLGKPARRRQVRDHIIHEHIDIGGLQETVKQDFSDNELQDLSGGLSFSWVWLEARGRSGGILVGVKGDILGMENHVCGEFSITSTFRNRISNFRWKVVTVYGPAHHDLSADFLEELNNICSSCELPLILGGISTLLGVRN